DDFASRSLKNINDIKNFMRDNNDNFKMLSKAEVLEKAKSINEFLTMEDPRREFRHTKKAFDEIKQALNDYLKELKEEVKTLYLKVFEELEQEAQKHKVDAATYADQEYTLKKIEQID